MNFDFLAFPSVSEWNDKGVKSDQADELRRSKELDALMILSSDILMEMGSLFLS